MPANVQTGDVQTQILNRRLAQELPEVLGRIGMHDDARRVRNLAPVDGSAGYLITAKRVLRSVQRRVSKLASEVGAVPNPAVRKTAGRVTSPGLDLNSYAFLYEDGPHDPWRATWRCDAIVRAASAVHAAMVRRQHCGLHRVRASL